MALAKSAAVRAWIEAQPNSQSAGRLRRTPKCGHTCAYLCAVRACPGQLSALIGFVWARRALNRKKWRFSARAVHASNQALGWGRSLIKTF